MKDIIKLIWVVIIMSLGMGAVALEQTVAVNENVANVIFSSNDSAGKTDYENQIIILEDYSPGCTKIGNKSVGGLCKLGNKDYGRGIGVNSPSRIRVKLPKEAVRLTSLYGLDRNVDKTEALVEFEVEVRGNNIFKSGLIYPKGDVYSLDLKLDGATEFDLIVNDGGNGPGFDQGDWCDTKVTFKDGTSAYIVDMATKPIFKTGFPFSFKYDGKNSADFLGSWDVKSEDIAVGGKTIRTVTATDPVTKLEVSAIVQIYKDTPGVDWTVYMANRGDKDTPVISDFKAVDLAFNLENGDRSQTKYANPGYIEPENASSGLAPTLHRMKGTTGFIAFTHEDFMPVVDKIKKNDEIVFGVVDSYSSQDFFPFFNTTFRGGGVITAIGWTGNWEAGVKNNSDGSIGMYAKMKKMNLSLHPNETIRSPRILQMYWTGSDIDQSYNLFRKTMLKHIVPTYKGEILKAPISHMTSSFYEVNSTTYEAEKSYIDAIDKHKLGFEVYWLDAWWHKGGFPSGLGNYVYPIETPVDMVRFPTGIKGISDYAKSKGLKFLCWFAPETLSEGSLLAKQHPEWMLPVGASSGNFNLGIDAAREYITDYMDACIKAWGIDYWRTDIGWTLNGIREMEKATPDRVGYMEIKQVEGFYKMWDDLRDRNPGLLIDNCCGGGSRIDLETSARSIPLWRTDGSVHTGFSRNLKDMAIQNQTITMNMNRYVPQSTAGSMGATPYYVRSGFNYGFTYDEDNRGDDYRNDLLAAGIEEVKRLRKYVFGDYYPLMFKTAGSDEWCAYQYHRENTNDGMVLIFKRDDSPYVTVELSFKDGTIDTDASYQVTEYAESYKPTKKIKIKGKDLLNYMVTIKDEPASLLIEYVKL